MLYGAHLQFDKMAECFECFRLALRGQPPKSLCPHCIVIGLLLCQVRTALRGLDIGLVCLHARCKYIVLLLGGQCAMPVACLQTPQGRRCINTLSTCCRQCI